MKGIRTIWFDFETTGLNPFHHKIIEISAIDNNGIRFDTLVKIDNNLDPEITKITGITDELLNTEGIPPEIAIQSFYQYILSDKLASRVFMIAHNGDSFDKLFLKTHLKKQNKSLPAKVLFIDSLFLSRLLYPKIFSHSLASLSKYFSITNHNAHRAQSDVNTLYNLWNIWMHEFEKQYGKNDLITVYNTIYY